MFGLWKDRTSVSAMNDWPGTCANGSAGFPAKAETF
jgi:hypothetical protein